MGRAFGFVVLMSAVAIGGYIYTQQIETETPVGPIRESAIDITAARNDLLALANAERRFFATNGKYASLDELRLLGDTPIPSRQNFTYSADVTDSTFMIIATYSGSDPNAPRRITVDENMSVTTN